MVNGEKIRLLREQVGLTTYELAEKVLASQTMISLIEKGVKKPSVDLLKRIADYFGLTMDDFIKSETA